MHSESTVENNVENNVIENNSEYKPEYRPEYQLSPTAESICRKRYYQKDENGNPIEDWSGLVRRVVNHVCKNESEEYKNEVYELMVTTKFLPNSPCLVNAGGKGKQLGLLACFVSKSPEDCWSGRDDEKVGMIENIANFGHIARMGGGCGISLSKIRPEGDPVFGSTHAKACGPVEHMRMISEVMASITQSGFRGMATIGVMRVDHPDIEKFITCKQKERALKSYLKEDIFNHYEEMIGNIDSQLQIVLDKFISNFNISVLVTDDFMNRVKTNKQMDLVFNDKVYKTVKAKDLFNLIAENAWKNGDPGLLFYDAINDSPYKYSKQEITATNPCGEEPIPESGSCNISSIDVSKFYDDEKEKIEWNNLRSAIRCCVRFLDNVIDVNKFPAPEFEKWAKENRPIGLGFMGFADLLLKMKISYGKKKSVEIAEELASFFQKEAHKASVELAKERGTPVACRYAELDFRRNVVLLTCAPTGTCSQIAGCNGSIEPFYSPITTRNDNTGKRLLVHELADKEYFRCAVDPDKKPGREVHWKEHVEIQAAFQRHICSGVSKTINLPNDATVEDVKAAYMLAWEHKCKGITIYRDGSKTTQVLNTSDRDKHTIQSWSAPARPKEVPADIFRTTAIGKEWHIIVGKVDNNPYELFAVNGRQELPSKGVVVKVKKKHYSLLDENREVLIDNISQQEKDIDINIDKETRRFSLELRHGIHPKFIIEQIDKSNENVTSFCSAVKRIFATKYISRDDLLSIAEEIACPDCARNGKKVQLIPSGGCWVCPEESCNYSRCG